VIFIYFPNSSHRVVILIAFFLPLRFLLMLLVLTTFLLNSISCISCLKCISVKFKISPRTYSGLNYRTNAISKVKGLIPILFCEKTRSEILKEVLELFLINPIPIRKDRVYERNFSSHARRYDMTYKTC